MSIPYEDSVLWGHSLQSYVNMFGLTRADLTQPILDCCGGPSSFNAELTRQGGNVISTDPLFSLAENALTQRIETVFSEMGCSLEAHKDRFEWRDMKSPKELTAMLHRNMKLFLDDFPAGIKEGRYLVEHPPELHFPHFKFDLALCSHYFFASYPNHTPALHLASIHNLCDVAREVRIFPLLDSTGEIPDLVGPMTQRLHEHGFGVEIKAVPYLFQKKGNAMLRIWAQHCEV